MINLAEIKKLKTSKRDKRKSIEKLYRSYLGLADSLWQKEIVYLQPADAGSNKHILLPILAFKTKKRGPALWLLAGVHGEEPAGPIAVAKQIRRLIGWRKKSPWFYCPF